MKERKRENEKTTPIDDFLHSCYQVKFEKKSFYENFITLTLFGC